MIKEYIIYKITNPIGQIYIGQTDNYSRRYRIYKNLSCKGQQFLYRSLINYGFDKHKFEIIHTSNIDNLDELEIKYIFEENSYYYDNKEYGLNLTKGGQSKRGYKTTQETKDKISKANKGKSRGKGRKVNYETKIKQSLIRKEKLATGEISKNTKNVLQLNKNNEVLKIWNSIKEVCEFLNVKRGDFIEYLKYNEFYENNNYKYQLKDNKPIIVKKYKVHPLYSQVSQVNLKTGEIKIFSSINKVAKYIDMSHSTVFRKIKSGNFIKDSYIYNINTSTR